MDCRNDYNHRLSITAFISLVLLLLLTIGVAHSANNTSHITHQFETQEKNEIENINEIVRLMKLRVEYGKTQSPEVSRFFHAKSHGCLQSKFTVLPLPEQHRTGLFAKPYQTFGSIIRFSNGNDDADDKKKNIRGAAIKVFLPEQTTNLATTQYQPAPSQDFLLVTGEAMFIDSIQTVHDLLKHLMIEKKKGPSFFLSNAFNGGLRLMWNASRAKVKIPTPFAGTYHSAAHYAFGEDKAARYSLTQNQCIGTNVIPRKNKNAMKVPRTNPNFLSAQLIADINQSSPNPICMTLAMQIQTDKKLANVESPDRKWKHPEPIAVAELRIETHTDEALFKDSECEDMSFRPWHSLVEHRPIGGLNRLRKFAYHELYAERTNTNN